MNVPQLLALGGGLLLIYSGIKGKSPVEVIKAGIAQSKTKSDTATPTASAVDPKMPAAAPAAQYNSTATPIAKFNK